MGQVHPIREKGKGKECNRIGALVGPIREEIEPKSRESS
jgi:hypothetical protein